jgi:hypothetical protein
MPSMHGLLLPFLLFVLCCHNLKKGSSWFVIDCLVHDFHVVDALLGEIDTLTYLFIDAILSITTRHQLLSIRMRGQLIIS